MIIPYKEIPTLTCSTGEWSYTDFESQEKFAEYLDSLWSDECDYKFDEDSYYFNEKARFFDENGYYTDLPLKSKARREFWKKEGEKSVRGVIIKGRKKQWYLPRDYYFVLNYGRIANKEKGDKDTFPDVRDIQYHLSLYLKRAEAHHKHAILTKKRQMMSSLLHCAKLINKYWFDRNSVNKVFASDTTFINTEDGIWKFFNKYRDFLNLRTDWFRNSLPNEEFSWMQRMEKTRSGRKHYSGRMSVLSGITLKVSATKGVGGAASYGYHEEAGMAPKLSATYGFFRPAVESGIYTTGMFIAAGSVGDLKQCEDLKYYMYRPESNGFLAVKSTWVNKERVPTSVGCYIPEMWGMPGFIDEYGNSKTMEAFEYLTKRYKDRKNDPKVSPHDYQHEISQHPIYLDDAFKHKEVSYFPADLLENQQERIELKTSENLWEFKPRKGLLKEDVFGKIVLTTPNPFPPEHQYPIKPEWPDKRGLVTIYEEPDVEKDKEFPEFYSYFAGIDTIEADVTTTSESVLSVRIFKNIVEVLYTDTDGKVKKKIEGDKFVAGYDGRFDSAEKTNEQAWLLIKKYNAFTLVERSKPNFISYMQRMGRADTFLAKESDIPVFADINYKKGETRSKFGFVCTAHNPMWDILKSYTKEYLLSEYGYVYKPKSDEVLRPLRGIDRIDDYWYLEELIQFNDDGNFDRFVAGGAAILIAKIHQQSQIIKRRNDIKPPENQQYIPPKPINLIGGGNKRMSPSYSNQPRKPKKPFSLL